MRRNILRAVLATGVAFISLPSSLAAHEFRVADLLIEHPWTRAVGERAQTAAGYMVIRNAGAAPDRLIAAETPRASRVELHEMSVTEGIMRMRPITDGIALPPGAEVRLTPGGQHLMLIAPQGGFAQGARVPVTLVFERAGRVEAELAVEAAGARGPAPHQGH
jgi:copper(I)-binding protein